MKALHTNKLFFSVSRIELSDDVNRKNHDFVKGQLRLLGVNALETVGNYKGSTEPSFLLMSSDIKEFEVFERLVSDLMADYNQECYLRVHHDSTAELVYTKDKSIIRIGEMRQVSRSEALKHESFTFIPNSETFLIVE